MGGRIPAHAAARDLPVVLHVTAVDYTLTKLMLNQLRFLEEAGYEVRVAAGTGPGGFPEELERYKPIAVDFPRTVNPFRIVRSMTQLRAITWSIQPTILHLHTPAVAMPVRILPRWLFPPEMLIAYTVHGYAHTWSPRLKDRLLQLIERALSGRADVTLFQSRTDFEGAQAHKYRGNLLYLGNGVDDDWFDIPAAESVSPLRLIFMGRLVREKGVLDLLDAVGQTSDVVLSIAGEELPSDRDGVYAEICRRIASPPLRGKVDLLGMLDKPALQRAVAAAQVVVLPSYREGVPQSLMQGLAAGRPAIATNIRGSTELVSHGSNGLLTEPGNTDGIRDAIEVLRDLAPGVFSSWARNAKVKMQSERRVTDVFSRLLSAYTLARAQPRRKGR